MTRRPRWWWTTVKGGRRARRSPYKYLLTRAEYLRRKRNEDCA